jgi:LuxR family transcriptional regulator, maltose regulon positive regulatory protein
VVDPRWLRSGIDHGDHYLHCRKPSRGVRRGRRLLAGGKLAEPPAGPQPPLEALSDSEIRVLRYRPTNCRRQEIANDLYVSNNTVRTHTRHLYAKLDTQTRADTVARARAVGLLAPSPRRGQATPRG